MKAKITKSPIKAFPKKTLDTLFSLVLALLLVGCGDKAGSSTERAQLTGEGLLATRAADFAKKLQRPSFPQIPVLEKNHKSKIVKLENSIEVLLVEDPKAAKTGISVDVAVGSNANPPDHRGLAHYVEHLLFLGSEKYPTAGEYDAFAQGNGGWSNAYTSASNTNYQLEINNSAIQEGMDRLAQFFVAPTFNEALMASELKNVDSEYQKNRQSTNRRYYYLRQLLSDPAHPYQNAFQGDAESLKSTTREVALEFFNKYYVAQLMKVAVISSLPLAEQEALVRSTFSNVKKTDQKLPLSSAQVDLEGALPRLLEYSIAEDKRVLTLQFNLNPTFQHWSSGPTSLFTKLMKYYGDGSLIFALKEAGLVTDLSISSFESNYGTSLGIDADLTELGLQKYEEVVKAIFSQIRKIQNQSLSERFFLETALIADFNYYYGTPTGSGGEGASELSKAMNLYGGAADLGTKIHRYTQYDPQLFQKIIEQLSPEKMTLAIGSKNFKGKIQSDRYDFEYTETSLKDSSLLKDLRATALNSKNLAQGFALPPENTFIPKSVSLSSKFSKDLKPVFKNAQGTLWQSLGTFPSSKARLKIEIPMTAAASTKRERVLRGIYLAALGEAIGRMASLTTVAGYDGKIAHSSHSFELEFLGYPNLFPKYVEDFIRKLTRLKPSRNEVLRAIEDAKINAKSTLQGLEAAETAEVSLSELVSVGSLDSLTRLSEIESIRPEEVLTYGLKLPFKRGAVGLAYGNISKDQAALVFQKVLSDLKVPTSAEAGRRVIDFVQPMGNIASMHVKTSSQNNAIAISFHLGKRTELSSAFGNLLNAFLSPAFYEEMRTKRTLGYIASAGIGASPGIARLNLLIQSNKNPAELRSIILEWLPEIIQQMRDIPSEKFEALKAGIIESLSKDDSNPAEQFSKLLTTLKLNRGDLSRRLRVIEHLKSITQAQLADYLQRAVDPKNSRRVTVYLTGEGQSFDKPPGEAFFTNSQEFHKALKLYQTK